MPATVERQPILLSKSEAARRLGLSTDAVLAGVRSGRLPVVVLSRRELIPASALDAFLGPAPASLAEHDDAGEGIATRAGV